jgi:hypothetical protein
MHHNPNPNPVSLEHSWYLLYPGEVGGILFYLCPSVLPSVQDIFLSHYRWQKSDIWSQASYRYAMLVTKYQISAINICWDQCDEKWAYMFNVYKNQQSRQTGSRNLMGPKTLPTTILWVAFLDLSDSYFLFADLVGF